jgi:hypothetical protein
MMNYITGWAAPKHIGMALICFGFGAPSFRRCRAPSVWPRGAKRYAPHVEYQGVFDGGDCAVIFKQLRNDISQGFAPDGVALDLFQFGGSFLSLAIDLPDSLCRSFTKNELIGLSGEIFAERATGFTVRLNIKHGPITEQLIQAHDLNWSNIGVEFDLEHLKINVNRVEKIWVDLVFETPNLNRISLTDIAFSKRPRGEI